MELTYYCHEMYINSMEFAYYCNEAHTDEIKLRNMAGCFFKRDCASAKEEYVLLVLALRGGMYGYNYSRLPILR
jgi:hypothetical protein